MTGRLAPIATLALLPLISAMPAVAQTGQQTPANISPATPDTSIPAKIAPPAAPAPNAAGQAAMQGVVAHAGTLTTADAEFVRKAALGGMAEVAAGKLAERASDDEVKQLAHQTVDAYERLGQQLTAVAKSKGDTVPPKLEPADAEQIANLSKISGREFDRTYATQQVKAHGQAVELFEQEASNGTDPDLKQLAQEALPTLQHHLQLAKDTERRVAAR